MNKLFVFLFPVFILIISSASHGEALGWTKPHFIKYIDSGVETKNSVLITLDDYINPLCSNNRIFLTSDDDQKFNQMMSMVLGSFYSGKKIDFYLNNSSNCMANRVFLYK